MRISGGSIYGSTTDLDAALARLEKDEAVLPQNRQLILKFANTWLAKGFTKVRVVKLVYCLRCGTPMEVQTTVQIEEEKKVGDNVLNKLMQNQEFKDFLFKKVVELGLDKQL